MGTEDQGLMSICVITQSRCIFIKLNFPLILHLPCMLVLLKAEPFNILPYDPISTSLRNTQCYTLMTGYLYFGRVPWRFRCWAPILILLLFRILNTFRCMRRSKSRHHLLTVITLYLLSFTAIMEGTFSRLVVNHFVSYDLHKTLIMVSKPQTLIDISLLLEDHYLTEWPS